VYPPRAEAEPSMTEEADVVGDERDAFDDDPGADNLPFVLWPLALAVLAAAWLTRLVLWPFDRWGRATLRRGRAAR
jgi:peptidoglycan/LPS O-acetylase OafA/YrhL